MFIELNVYIALCLQNYILLNKGKKILQAGNIFKLIGANFLKKLKF